jgi:hypothetical protein
MYNQNNMGNIKFIPKSYSKMLNKLYPKIQGQSYKVQLSNTNLMNAFYKQCLANPAIQVRKTE